jgi:hypothetical protein
VAPLASPPAAAPPLAAVEPVAAVLALLVAADAAGAAALVDVDEVSPKEHEVSTSSAVAETAAAAIRPRLVVHSVRDNGDGMGAPLLGGLKRWAKGDERLQHHKRLR